MDLKVKINSIKNIENNPVKASASVILDNAFVIKGITVKEGQYGLYTSMPGFKGKDGVFVQMFEPANADAKKELNAAVLNAYEQACKNLQTQNFKRDPAPEKAEVPVEENEEELEM